MVNASPELEKGQYTVLICQSTTGIVLDEKLEYHLSGSSSPYFIFNSLVEAKSFIDAKGKPDSTFQIFDSSMNNIFKKHFDPIIIKPKSTNKWWKFW